MTAIVLMAVGVIVLLCPSAYISTLIGVLGVLIVMISVVMILEFVVSKKALINFILLTAALILLILGMVVLIFELDMIYAIAWIFGIGLIVDGVFSVIHSLMFDRRSKRKAWWVMLIFSALLIAFGILIICNPWWNTPESLLQFIGLIIVFSSIVSALRLIWVWPIRNA